MSISTRVQPTAKLPHEAIIAIANTIQVGKANYAIRGAMLAELVSNMQFSREHRNDVRTAMRALLERIGGRQRTLLNVHQKAHFSNALISLNKQDEDDRRAAEMPRAPEQAVANGQGNVAA